MAIDVERLIDRRNDDRWNRMAVGDILERVAWAEPDKPALIAAPEAVADPRYARVGYRQGDRLANQVANALLALGLRRGDRVAMFCENSVEAYLVKLGIAKAGLVAVPINTMMAGDLVVHMLRHVAAEVAVVDADHWAEHGAAYQAATGIMPVAGIRGGVPLPPGVPEFHDLVRDMPDTEPDVRIHGDDIWEILPTSGTTAMPKAVMVSHTYSYSAAFAHALSYTRGLAVESQVRICTYLPMIFHIGDHAYLLAAFLSGGTAVLGRRPTGAAIAATVTRERITALWGGSPQFLAELARAVRDEPGRFDLSSIEVIIYGWSAMPPELTDELTEMCGGRVQFVGIFGQTEAIACHRFWPNSRPELHRRTAPQTNYVGVPAPLLGSTVVDADGRSLADSPGVPGEAVYRSPAMFSGYYRDEAATRNAFRHGWFHSGDMCSYGEDGLRIMVDRYKDVVKSGGENVSSIRVESVLGQHPAVSRAAVVGVPHERWGEEVVGVVVAEPGASLDEPDVIAFCRARLAGYETPKRLVVLDDLPSTVGGKVLKYRLREMLRDRPPT
ncbi:class I adenylate-forming enzyme family protein [Acrocarpospora catenulata]|uniref:class I adenylate-forming enzyme family protein n=1 Tax=Acrocarpospora catenulata TaxID=2836182 RepID=UPI001BD91AF9|nr:AMP-binding protein [Acrocarpospora catenulata]